MNRILSMRLPLHALCERFSSEQKFYTEAASPHNLYRGDAAVPAIAEFRDQFPQTNDDFARIGKNDLFSLSYFCIQDLSRADGQVYGEIAVVSSKTRKIVVNINNARNLSEASVGMPDRDPDITYRKSSGKDLPLLEEFLNKILDA